MPFDGSGNYARVHDWTLDKTNGFKVRADRMDEDSDDFATAFNATFLRSGLVPMAGVLDMGAFRITGVASGTVGSPGFNFDADVTSGLFLNGVGKTSIVAGGVNRLEAGAAGVAVTGTFSTSGNSTIGDAVGDVHTVNGQLTVTGVLLADSGIQARGIAAQISLIDTDSVGNLATGTIRFRDSAGTDEATIQKPAGATSLTFNLGSGGTLGLTITATAVSPVSATTASAANVHQASSGSALLRSTSARRYKTDIQNITLAECYSVVKALRAISYISRADADDDTKRFFGYIAEEVATISKHLVHWLLIANDDISLDDEGNVIVDGETVEAQATITTAEGIMVPDGVMYERIAVLQGRVLDDIDNRLTAIGA